MWDHQFLSLWSHAPSAAAGPRGCGDDVKKGEAAAAAGPPPKRKTSRGRVVTAEEGGEDKDEDEEDEEGRARRSCGCCRGGALAVLMMILSRKGALGATPRGTLLPLRASARSIGGGVTKPSA